MKTNRNKEIRAVLNATLRLLDVLQEIGASDDILKMVHDAVAVAIGESVLNARRRPTQSGSA